MDRAHSQPVRTRPAGARVGWLLASLLALGCGTSHGPGSGEGASAGASGKAPGGSGAGEGAGDAGLLDGEGGRADAGEPVVPPLPPIPPIVNCFAAGVRIATPTGERPIEAVAVGDEVLAYDLSQARVVTRRVTATHRHGVGAVLRLATSSGRELAVTADHPIYSTAARDFVAAAALADDGEVLELDADDPAAMAMRPASLRGETTPGEAVPVYNLTVQGVNNYFAEGVLVHNKSRCGYPGDPPDCPCTGDECGPNPIAYPDAGTAPLPLPSPTHLPTAQGQCPDFAAGVVDFELDGTVMQWRITEGRNPSGGPLVLLWSDAGVTPATAPQIMLGTAMDDVAWNVTLVATAEASSLVGDAVALGPWTTGDLAFADEVVACAIERRQIDPNHIHVVGYRGGAMQAVNMYYERAGYVASVVSYSGGLPSFPLPMIQPVPQDPERLPGALAAHGAPGLDVLLIDFSQASDLWLEDIVSRGRPAIRCNDGLVHVDLGRFAVAQKAWQFMRDHPWGVDPPPYSTLPDGFPDYCELVTP